MQVDTFKKIFESNPGLFPSLSQFLSDAKEKLGKDYNRKDAMKWYYAQQIVQVFGPPPLMEALKRKKGFYPKIISFFPFERLYVDTGSISIFKFTRKQEKKMQKEKIKVEDGKPTIAITSNSSNVEKPVENVIQKPIVEDKGDWKIKEGQYSNRGKITPFIAFKKGDKRYRFEKYYEDIEKARQWLNDNIKNPFYESMNKDDFLQSKKGKKG
jgi:hypothetical protein